MIFFVSGLYESISAADGLHKYLAPIWKNKGVSIDRFFRFDQKTELRAAIQLVPASVPLSLIGFSWGGSEAVAAAAATGRAIDVLLLLDPVNQTGSAPFSLPGNVRRAYCIHRGADQCRQIQSRPISSAACPFINRKFNPAPANQSEASAHGQPAREPAEILAIVRATGGGL